MSKFFVEVKEIETLEVEIEAETEEEAQQIVADSLLSQDGMCTSVSFETEYDIQEIEE